MDDPKGLFRKALCGCCRKHVARCKSVNLVELRKHAKWEHPTAGNVITGERGRAVAVLCDACFEQWPQPQILWAVEFADGELRYHHVGDLDDVVEQKCRVCGCTDRDCFLCVERTGEPCEWVAADLCSACSPGDDAAVQAFREWKQEWDEFLAEIGAEEGGAS